MVQLFPTSSTTLIQALVSYAKPVTVSCVNGTCEHDSEASPSICFSSSGITVIASGIHVLTVSVYLTMSDKCFNSMVKWLSMISRDSMAVTCLFPFGVYQPLIICVAKQFFHLSNIIITIGTNVLGNGLPSNSVTIPSSCCCLT